jgi:hypothetical protein
LVSFSNKRVNTRVKHRVEQICTVPTTDIGQNSKGKDLTLTFSDFFDPDCFADFLLISVKLPR